MTDQRSLAPAAPQAPAGPSTVTTGLNAQTVPRCTVEELLEGALGCGADGVELTGELVAAAPAELRAAVRSSPLRIFGVTPTPALHDWHWRWDEPTERRFTAEVTAATECQAEYFVMPFMRPPGDRRSVERGLGRAVEIAEHVGIDLAVEPIGHCPVLRRAEELAPVLRGIGNERLGVLLDSFHWYRAGHELGDLDAYDGLPVRALQVSNAVDLPTSELLGYRDRTFPLDGRFDVLGLCREVRARAPEAPVIVEVLGEVAQRTATSLALATVRRQLGRIRAHITEQELA